ncbi:MULTISPECIES: primosomal protein N' [unclassified Limnobacter]|uniref:primosomal protein N' n=1 Tax=unclassified Limnobacter TaxID=2630203 RepID=UPI0025C44757|nr:MULTISPECIES: primosomal protein N' [unclassified Limnobacter]
MKTDLNQNTSSNPIKGHTLLVNVLVAAPLPKAFTYQWHSEHTPRFGMRVIVPWGRQHRIGLVQGAAPDQQMAENIKPVHSVLDHGECLSAHWQALIEFAAKYYHHPLGMIALEALPKALRVLNARGEEPVMVAKSREHAQKLLAERNDPLAASKGGKAKIDQLEKPVLNAEQLDAVAQLSSAAGFQPFLLYGVTGSGKTEVYLHTVEERLKRGEQVLVLLPEINLTPAAQALYKERLAPHRVVVMHSNLAELTRTKAWFEAATGAADVIIATRLGVLTPLPRLGMIVVDEEHDPSYKQQDGMRYHARDLALMLAKQREVPIVLGSATPALESWLKADLGAYKRLSLKNRAVLGASLPKVELINTANFPAKEGLSEPAMQALVQNFEAGKQSIVFLNRRGYAPQMVCNACGWVANCDHCTAHMVWHKNERMLRCHHCGAGQRVPTHCPTCGNQDLTGFGRGTQRIEETLTGLLPTANILRIDADSTRNKGQMEALLQQAHSGEADVLVGTQMIAKGHDFANVTLVLALNVDASLYSHAYRAPERLFAQLMQVAGRAGRRAGDARMVVQTRYPQHPLFDALKAHDYETFASHEMQARKDARMPPFSHQATIRADHKKLANCLQFLSTARELGEPLVDADNPVFMCDPVPLTVVRVGGIERAQMLIESESRPALHRFLTQWLAQLHELPGSVRWFLEVDPVDL